EITIGLFPDVGGTWLLSRLPGGTGRFLAFTGAQMGAADCLFLGLADHALETSNWPALMERIKSMAWHDDATENAIELDQLFESMAMSIDDAGPLERHYHEIRRACDGHDFESVSRRILEFSEHEDPWLQRAASTLKAGSPGSARLSFTLLNRAKLGSLADAFRQEYIAAQHCGAE